MVMEVLSCMLEKAKDVKAISGIRLPNNGPNISHLFYADDAIIIGEWSRDNIANVVRILRVFHLCSGLKINISKSNIFAIGVRANELEDMALLIECQAGEFPMIYLGLNVGANMNRSLTGDRFMIFLTRDYLRKASHLSIGGRVTLIKVVLESLTNYYFSLYKVPSKVIKDLECKIRKFLWGGNDSNNKLHWVDWERVTLPKESGGLGLVS
ncbi:uncharacterized protein LOC110900092 [Helianthus annuus]|uniref:uncharacterized protein LOC110900092 n=1 Tax=Helianthus annuus TaxID=4232 RepID=UPI000B8EECC5|nr:uncharacterized protein LOC110900092 [Helianthus annuus]